MIILIVVHILVLSRLQFTAWPEMFSFPYMISNGFLIYKDFHHVYQPLLTFILLGIYKIFGFKMIVLKIFTYLLLVLTDLMIFLNVKKLANKKSIAILSLGMYVLLQPIFDGNMLWFDIAVMPPILLALYFIDVNLFVSGFFVAISFLVKQQSVLIALPILIYFFIKKVNIKNIFKFILGAVIPVFVLFIFLYKYNIFSDYFFWTFKFPLLDLPKIPGYAINPTLQELKVLGVLLLTLIAGIAINFKKLTSKFYWRSQSSFAYLLISILFLLILSAFPRFSFFHLQPALAIFVILIGYLSGFGKKYFLMILIPVLFLWKGVLLNPHREVRFYGINEKRLASEIKDRVKGEKVYFLGPNSIEYVLSDTIPPKPWIENYIWHFEIDGLQEKVINGWIADSPTFIYWTRPELGEWYELGTYQPKKIVEYIKNNYMKVDTLGDVEIWKIKSL